MRYFPIFVDLQDKPVTVIGGGEEALRKVRLLLKTGAKIRVVAPALHDELAREPRVEWLARAFDPAQLDGSALVYSADPQLNAAVSAAAQARGVPVNAVDEADISTFITPSIVDRDPLVIAIGTEGAAPVLAMGLRAKIDAMLPQGLGLLAAAAQDLRARVAARIPAGAARRGFWQTYFFGPLRESFLSGDKATYARELETVLAGDQPLSPGRVSLVGAGPGDPELLTLKAQRKLFEADVIVHDRLVSPAVLEMARRDAVRIPVGKTPFQPSPAQADIEAILIREAKAGRKVVRLKGGDPFVFGRGAEELAALKAAGIPVDIVPGITAALGCAASAQLPLTTRGHSRAITLITGTAADGFARHDWNGLAQGGHTIAIYMGLNAAGHIASELSKAGLSASAPVILVENGTLASQRVIETTLSRLAGTVVAEQITAPALIYIGLARSNTSAEIVPFPVRDDIRDAIMRAAS